LVKPGAATKVPWVAKIANWSFAGVVVSRVIRSFAPLRKPTSKLEAVGAGSHLNQKPMVASLST